jgi:hypothetical protein
MNRSAEPRVEVLCNRADEFDIPSHVVPLHFPPSKIMRDHASFEGEPAWHRSGLRGWQLYRF